MSRHNDPMMMIMEMIFGEDMKEDTKEKETTHAEPPTETKGFESLISKEEYEAIKGVKEALDKYIEVHNKNAVSMIDRMDKITPYGMIQYSILSDVVNEAMSAVSMMYGIHTLDKECLDEMAKDSGCDNIKDFEHKTLMMLLMKKMKG